MLRRTIPILTLALSLGLASACGNVNVALEKVSEARRLGADLLVQFTKTADAGNRAVMADTDETSVEFAREAEQATAAAQKDITALAPTLQALGYSDETRLLSEFTSRFDEYRTLDRRILDLAVENTNLKAQRLAFGPAQEAANALRDALKSVTSSSPANAWHVEALVAETVTTVREIQVLQAPHIADADDGVMTRMETQMSTSVAAARTAIQEVRGMASPASQSKLDAASAALTRFIDLNAQIIALSRRNTNVRSLALSLDQKRKITVSCEESLRALESALAKRGYSGIREH